MDVKEFLSHFKADIPIITDAWTYDDYLKWHSEFYKKTLEFHSSAKQSYFELSNQLIDNRVYFDTTGTLGNFAYLGLFTDEDETEFVNLIRKATFNLTKIDNEADMETILSYLYWMSDFLFHEIDYRYKIALVMKELKTKIEETKNLDKKGTGELVVRFIDLIYGETHTSH